MDTQSIVLYTSIWYMCIIILFSAVTCVTTRVDSKKRAFIEFLGQAPPAKL